MFVLWKPTELIFITNLQLSLLRLNMQETFGVEAKSCLQFIRTRRKQTWRGEL